MFLTSRRKKADDLLRRARGAYLAFACGDALGATVEFLTAGEIRAQYGVHRHLVGGGWLRLKPGQITDDTQMSLALGDALVEKGDWDLPCIADHFLAWLKTKPIDVGNTCRRGITRYMRHGTLESPYSDGDAGNGAAMRNLPVILASLGDDDAFARWTLAQAHFTHNHPLSDLATLTLGCMTRALLLGEGKTKARSIADALVAGHRNFRFDPYPKRCTGYVVDTLQTVCHCFFNTDSLEECLVETVNLGGDADTNGAIAGMLAGAYYGEEALPYRWMRRLDRPVQAHIGSQVDGLLALAWSRATGPKNKS
ncbi:ADP-ribosyl-[dinitrogen reductase] hydrolase [Azospira inquinata]|uniref:ADP-ribosyl-[dinitrogen reductase] hydrolase n=1 Tax=Azospira inquinata TaxID=2785627 RepID=UPI001E5177A3|nr:ADP-ribosyl-[dinitrogen reductase] hydrolase [Azospira inquinata]